MDPDELAQTQKGYSKMKKTISIAISLILLAAMFLQPSPARALSAQQFYLVPIQTINTSYRVPSYFCSRFVTSNCIASQWALMDYGILPNGLLLAINISQADNDALCLHADVYCFPDNLDTPASQSLKGFVEGINIPSDWTTPSTSNRELLRKLAGMMQFNQRYSGSVCPGETFLGVGGVTLDTKWNALTTHQKDCFNQTVITFGVSFTVSGNPSLRTIIKRAGDFWDGIPFYLGSFEF